MGNWHILGVGCIGSLWAVHLKQTGLPVSLILRSSFLDPPSLSSSSLSKPLPSSASIQVEHQASPKAYATIPPHPICFPLFHVSHSTRISNLLITTKAHQTISPLLALIHHGCLAPDANLVFLQNGLGVVDEWMLALGGSTMLRKSWRIIMGSTNHGCTMLERNSNPSSGHLDIKVKHTGYGTCTFSEMPLGNALAPTSTLSDSAKMALKDLNIEALNSRTNIDWPHMQTVLSLKLLVNCCINPLTALYRCTNGQLLSEHQERVMPMIRAVCEEGRLILQTYFGRSPNWVTPEEALEAVIEVIRVTETNVSSMYADVMNNRPTEIFFLNGFLVRQGQRLQLPVTMNTELYHQILATHRKGY